MRIISARPIVAAYPHSWRIDNGQQQPLILILFRVLLAIRIPITPYPTEYEGSCCTTHTAFELRSKVTSKQLYRIFRIHQPLSLRNNPQVQISSGLRFSPKATTIRSKDYCSTPLPTGIALPVAIVPTACPFALNCTLICTCSLLPLFVPVPASNAVIRHRLSPLRFVREPV